MSNIRDEIAGRFRKDDEYVRVGSHIAPASKEINGSLNGRIGRVINNHLLIREGFVPINIKFIDRKKYYEAFKEFDEKGAPGIMEDSSSYYKNPPPTS